mmetsp:Transcript_7558/g.19198  ORF Transcript_7558/g.19198 Transcript_7558/m.19198 type:complete len:1480 (-) Transcript_7558:51-4490(-)
MPPTAELELRHPPSIARVTVHVPAAGRKVVIFSVFLILHSIALKLCIDTSGDAYQVAVERQRRINREHHLNGTKPEDMPPQDPLPSTWAPNSWASAGLFASLSLHALFFLLCHWKVKFRAATLFSPATSMREGHYVQVTPHAHRGKAALVPVWFSEASTRLVFTFQRQRYEYWEPESEEPEDMGEVRLVRCPVDDLISTYLEGTGLRSDQVDDLKEHFGDNLLEVEMPSFLQCYKEQLLTPLVIFQVFVALLWAADDFVGYTLMQLGFILVFESTSVFQRLRTMKMLNSMGTKSYGIQVYRGGEWAEISTADLLPGDIVELTAVPPPSAPESDSGAKDGAAAASTPPAVPEQKIAPDIVPCDCIILRGEAVVSEASLTGESAPQMKDALQRAVDRPLDVHGTDRVHSLFSGTRLLRASEGRHGNRDRAAGEAHGTSGSAAPGVPRTPDGGCLCYVVRTGFASSQGELLQMIEFSQEKVSGDTKEVLIALLVLLCFALVAAGYVLKTGLEKGEKTPHELLIKCIIILTAVVPRQLPMQMAVAVNTALMALIRSGVYCTEPYRVPLAGKLTHCLFDKTGTLTTDTLVPVGIVNSTSEPSESIGYPPQSAVPDASPVAALILAACHSLVAVEGKLTGDPIEVAALEGVGWRYDADSEIAKPVTLEASSSGSNGTAVEDGQDGKEGPTDDSAEGKAGDTDQTREHSLSTPPIESVHVLHRFHFASHLQRMAVVVDVTLQPDLPTGKALDHPGRYSLVKGSPEALRPLLSKSGAPPWYDRAHTSLAESGLRVLALAYRKLEEDSEADKLSREEVESNLFFAGFIAFECKARADSGIVLGALRESDHRVAMLTGDSPLTALHIAKTCGIVETRLPGLLLTVTIASDGQSGSENIEWVVATGEQRGERRPISENFAELATNFALMATGDALDAAVARQPEFWQSVDEIRVFARMTPQGKATVIRELQRQGRHVLMCGDGGNDVGALKQADVGLALLAGYGNVNTTEVATTDEEKMEAEVVLNERQAALAKRTKEAGKARQKYLWDKQKELNAMHKQWLEEEVEARAARGDNGFMAQAGAVKVVLAKYTAELKKEMKEYDMKNGNVYDGDGSDTKKDPVEEMKKKMESMEQQSGLPMVRPGDASVAAPFTSKAPSVKNCVDLIRQGRCTLLSALQQQQIMMLNCIINAYVLSALSLEGSRSSERQMMGSHWLLTTASLAFAYASPCDRMHPVRPLRSLFHPAVFVSMLGQAAIHLACMVTAVRMARSAMEEGSAERQAGWTGPSLKDVSEFWRVERLKRRGLVEKDEPEEEDWTQMALQLWMQPFLPNLMNTVVFLVETAQTVAILFVNYKGQPWMKGVMENRALFLSVFVVAASVAAAAWELSPQLNELIHLSPFPSDHFRWAIMGLVMATLAGTFVWDRLCVAIFAPEIFRAMLQSAKATTFKNDIVPIFKTVGKVATVFLVIGTGNLLLAAGMFFMWKRSNREE